MIQRDVEKFWNQDRHWPRDALGYVFLASAVNQLGSSLYPDDWNLLGSHHNHVVEDLYDGILRGSVRTALREVSGGAIDDPLPASDWHQEKWRRRFDLCQMETRIEGYGPTRIVKNYIFVNKGDLEKFVAGINARAEQFEMPRNVPDDVYLSPYMLLAIDAIRHHGITEHNHETVEAIKAWLVSEAKARGFELSNNMRDAIPTLIRHPVAQQGKAGKKSS